MGKDTCLEGTVYYRDKKKIKTDLKKDAGRGLESIYSISAISGVYSGKKLDIQIRHLHEESVWKDCPFAMQSLHIHFLQIQWH